MEENGYYLEHRTSRSTKRKKEWYIPMANYVISQIDSDQVSNINDKKLAISGVISDDYYKKVLNPFNATDPKFTRHRADMRNFDIMKDVIRRYMGEYSKQPFDFQVKANDPEVITRFNEAFNAAIAEQAVQLYINELNKANIETGQPSKDVPDFNLFFKEFKEHYIDDVAAQGQALLTAIIDWTDSRLKYYKAFYDYIVLGQTYTYRDVRNDVLHKEVIDPTEYFPISNGEPFIEDHDRGVRMFKVTIPQLLENFSTILDTETYNKIATLFKLYRNGNGIHIPLQIFKSKLDSNIYTTFTKANVGRIAGGVYRLTNKDDTIDGYHVVYTTQVKIGHLLKIDPITGQITEDIIEADTYTLNPSAGDMSITWEWINEVWETYRFGTESDDIYSQARPIAYQRRDANNLQKVKLPYNGISEVVPGTTFTFSIPDIILPFQIARNIFAFYREKIIAKNKDKVIVIAESLLGDENAMEDKIYRLESNSVLAYDDSEDDASTKAQAIRVLDASLSQFIGHISDLMDRMRAEAWDGVDMSPQRYGDIQTSAGKGTTEEAIVRSSMGSVIIFTMFERFLEKEYIGDLEYSKFAYINGKVGSYTDLDGNTRFLDLDVDKHILANYGIHVVSSVSQNDKKKALTDIAFAASQNGDIALATKTVLADNIASIKKAFDEYEKAKAEYERSVTLEAENIKKEAEQIKADNDKANRDNKKEIAILQEQGDTEREIIKAQNDLLKIEVTLETATNVEGNSDITAIKQEVDQQKIALEVMKQNNDMRKHKDNMQLKREDIASKEKIAKQNKNRYDVKSKK